MLFLAHIKSMGFGLAAVAQWIEHHLMDQAILGSIPGLGHLPGLQARSLVEGMQEAAD